MVQPTGFAVPTGQYEDMVDAVDGVSAVLRPGTPASRMAGAPGPVRRPGPLPRRVVRAEADADSALSPYFWGPVRYPWCAGGGAGYGLGWYPASG